MQNFNTVITNDNKSFYIDESTNNNTKGSAKDSVINKLKKMEIIVANQLTYDPNHQDKYSSKGQTQLFAILKTKSSEIRREYCGRQPKTNWVFKKFFSKEKEINAINAKIDKYVNLLPLLQDNFPTELVQMIVEKLPVTDLNIMARLNPRGEAEAISAIATRAKKFGYEGGNDIEAVKYVHDLFHEVNRLAKKGLIPKEYLSYSSKSSSQKVFDSEKILQKLQSLSAEEMLPILIHEELHAPAFEKVRKMIRKTHSDEALVKAVPKSGVDIEARDYYRGSRLCVAARKGQKGYVGFLLNMGADVNSVGIDGSPLYQAKSAEITRILLESGKAMDLNYAPVFQGRNTPLHEAVWRRDLEQVRLLLDYGASVNLTNSFSKTALDYTTEFDVFSGSNDKRRAIQKLLLERGALTGNEYIYGRR